MLVLSHISCKPRDEILPYCDQLTVMEDMELKRNN